MSFRYGSFYYSLIAHLNETNRFKLLHLIEIWLKYNNPNLPNAVEYILEYIDELPVEFYDKFIELLNKYNKTEWALLCVRKRIEREKKERFEL